MDYGIVMLHAFRGFKAQGLTSYDAAVAAMHKAAAVIASSAATTFFGFLSLCVMAFLIGADMGVVLAKGIVFSFLCVLFLLPILVLSSEKLLKKTAHKKFLPSFDKFAVWCMTNRRSFYGHYCFNNCSGIPWPKTTEFCVWCKWFRGAWHGTLRRNQCNK